MPPGAAALNHSPRFIFRGAGEQLLHGEANSSRALAVTRATIACTPASP